MRIEEKCEVMGERQEKAAMELAMEAGHVLLESGAEIFRVEETMDRICRHYGVQSGNAFVLSNGIFATTGSERERYYAKVQHIPVSGTHLDRVAAVNQLSREIEEGRYSLEEARRALGGYQAYAREALQHPGAGLRHGSGRSATCSEGTLRTRSVRCVRG